MKSLSLANEPNPILKANFFSKWFYCWIGPLLSKGYKTPLLGQDLYNLVENEEAKYLTDQLEKEWKKELLKLEKSKKPSLLMAICRIWCLKFALNSLLAFFEETLRILFPLLIAELLGYFSGSIDFHTALIYGTLLAVGILFAGLIHHPYVNNSLLYGMRLRVSLAGLVYRETFKLKSNTLDSENGHIVSLMSTDAARLEASFVFLPFFVIAPLQVVFVVFIMIQQIGVTFLAGLVLLLVFVPVQIMLGKLYSHVKNKQTVQTDKRINIILEIVSAIKIIKMYCWEEPYEKIIKRIRKSEMKYQAYVNGIAAVNSLLENDFCCLITFTSIAVLVNSTSMELKASYVVFAIGFYTRLCCTLGFWLSKSIICTIGALISVRRYQDFLSKPKHNGFQQVAKPDEENKQEPSISISQMSLRWTKDSLHLLRNISVELKSGELLILAGPSGAGKSILLQSILNEVPHIEGSIKVTGRMFFVSQEPWLFPASVKDNILFGKPYVKDKFDLIIKCCFLVQDLKSLSHAENTLIGDKGTSLSGGQRTRVCLARALYSDADIYLLDDPLSAVDNNVSRHLYERCIEGYLRDKIRILVTHNVQHLAKADRIILLDKEKVLAQGSYDEIVDLGLDLEQLLNVKEDTSHQLAIRRVESSCDGLNITGSQSSFFGSSRFIHRRSSSEFEMGTTNENEDQAYKEKRIKGSINKTVFYDYFSSGGGYIGGVLVIVLFVMAQGFILFADFYLANWANYEENYNYEDGYHNQENWCGTMNNSCPYLNLTAVPVSIRKEKFLNYSILVVIAFTIVLLRSFIYYYLQTRSCINYHAKMLKSVISTYLRFFDLNPIGRLANRFSRDIGCIDEQLPQVVFEFLQLSMVILGALTFSVIVNYWTLIAIVPLFFACYYIRKYFIVTLNELKRLEGIYRSPIFVQVNNTLNGMLTIRAYKNIEVFHKEFEYHLNNYTKVCSSTINMQRWFQCRLDLIATLFATVAIFSSILGKDYFGSTSGQVGLLLTYLLNLTSLFQWLVVQNCEVSSLMTSVERIKEYTSLEKERDVEETEPDKDWPASGEILFDDVSLAYAKNLPFVLKDLLFEIYPGEKIGVVGRTGAGKSSLIQAIFRLTEPIGTIYIDGVDIKTIGLKKLRNKITIIPQEPVLFEGTIRTNLDPFNHYSDINIWNALEQVQLKRMIKGMKHGLDSIVLSGGKNLSVGEKQLMCLARAIIKRSKILIIDEATANVDYQTDALVQKSIRKCFSDCTVLTIAHRIETIIDSNRVMCFNGGKLESFGNPYDLLISHNYTVFKNLVQNLGKTEAARLTELARLAKLEKEPAMADKCDIKYEIEEVFEEKEPFLKKNMSMHSFSSKSSKH